MRVVLLPRGHTVSPGPPTWMATARPNGCWNRQKVRAVFSAQDGGRWMEFTWKDTNTNFLPESGRLRAGRPGRDAAAGDALEFAGKGWKRTATLNGATLTVEQSTPLPPEILTTEKRGNLTLTVERPAPTRAVYTLH